VIATEAKTESAETVILLDVGSTNSRAWLVRGDEILRRETAAVGVRDSARDGSTARVRETVRDLIATLRGSVRADSGSVSGDSGSVRGDSPFQDKSKPLSAGEGFGERGLPVFAAGMITSPLGLQEVPHVVAPAGADELARGAIEFQDAAVAPQPIVLIPGVRTEAFDGAGAGAEADGLPFDVMRGEETLVCGLIARGQLGAGAALLNASSHWKLIRVDAERRIAGSRTSLGGEVVHSVQSGTILSASLPAGPLDRVSTTWLEAGARAGRRDGLLRALFGVRLLDQQKLADAPERFSFLAGACIAEDIDALLAIGALTPGTPIAVSGPAAVPVAWAHLLSLAGCPATPLDADTIERGFITGLLAIARRRTTLAASHA
jgi:2-dehydro-3-deoxygalactonokinase